MRSQWRPMRAPWLRRTLLQLLPFALWVILCFVLGGHRTEAIVLLASVCALACATPATRRLLAGIYPILLTWIPYDAMRFVLAATSAPARAHVCDLRAIELALFGFEWRGRRATLQDWFLVHHHLVLDVYCALPYATFFLAWVILAALLYAHDYARLVRFGRSFLAMNLAAFATYVALPAAPPWYFHARGCTVDPFASASAGPALARVDALLGVRLFDALYSRSATVFGALPSLHVAYAVLICLAGWRLFGPVARLLALLYALSMAFAAVYLDHHWLLDVLLGALYALAAHLLAGAMCARSVVPRSEALAAGARS